MAIRGLLNLCSQKTAHQVLHRKQHVKFSPTRGPSGRNVVASRQLGSWSPPLLPATSEAVELVKSTRYIKRSINGAQTCFNSEQNVAISPSLLLAESLL